jgi:hypothetical protein
MKFLVNINLNFCLGKRIYKQFRSSLVNIGGDIHAKLMIQYAEVPWWWYMTIFIITFSIAAIVCHYGQLMPWYLLFRRSSSFEVFSFDVVSFI